MKSVTKYALVLVLLGLFWIGACGTSRTHDDAFSEEGLLVANASNLKHTEVTSHLEAAIAGDQSVLWCASFQLAWNEACALVGEDLHFANDEPAMVEVLNKKTFTRQHLDQESYVAVAGFVKDDVFGEIDRQLAVRFKGEATPRYLPPKHLTTRPQDIVAYSYLFKHLEFAVPFERIADPMAFGTEQLPCFGIGETFKHEHHKMLEQVVILDYQSEDDFVVELETKGQQDQLILAKVQPAKTLQETVIAVQARAANAEPKEAVVGDVLKVPKLNFDITRNYRELAGKNLAVQNPKIARDLMVLSAVQNIRFQLDEEGVRLRSESHISFGCGAAPPPPPTRHIMVFDKPFLMLLKRVDADVPYFAMWVQNPELLVKVKW